MTFPENNSLISTRFASLADLELLLSWAADEGWNPGLSDAALFHATAAQGFLVSFMDEKLVAGISLVKHSSDQAFLGLYICAPQWRGKGIGMAIWNRALALVEGHTIGLDGVADQQDNYRQCGFEYHFGNQRFAGVLSVSENMPRFPGASNDAVTVTEINESHTKQLIKYDAQIGGFERAGFLRAWMNNCTTRNTFVATAGEQIMGVVGVRQCQDGFKVGPWLADTPFIATQLLQAVSAVTKGVNVMIDIPDVNSAAIDIAEALALVPMFETARMYKGAAPVIGKQRLFGVATLELG